MKKPMLVLFVFAAFLVSGCAAVSSQSNLARSNVQTKEQVVRDDENRKLVGTTKNTKYGLSVLFYADKNEEPANFEGSEKTFDQIVFRRDDNGEKSKPLKIRGGFPIVFQDVWSPNEEYLLLPGGICGQNGFCVYKTAEIAGTLMPNSDFAANDPADFVKLTFTGSQPKSERGKVKPCQHFFEKWISETTFAFKARAMESKDGRGDFEYDLSRQKIFSGLEKFGGVFEAVNKNGKLEFIRE